MDTFFVSENKMLQSMLEKVCQEQNCPNILSFDAADALPALSDGDIVLLHVTSSLQDAETQVDALQACGRRVRIILLARERLISQLRAELSARTHAIIPENSSVETLISALIVVQQGYRLREDHEAAARRPQNALPFSLGEIGGLGGVGGGARLTTSLKEAALSKRERAILARLSEGGSNKDIANALGIQEATVKVHLRACYRKIGARNRTQAAVWATERLSC